MLKPETVFIDEEILSVFVLFPHFFHTDKVGNGVWRKDLGKLLCAVDLCP